MFLDVMVFHDLWLVFMISQDIFMVSGWYSWFSRYFHVFFFIYLSLPSSAMQFILLKHQDWCFCHVLRFIDHRMRLLPMVTNHWSSDAMFAMYRSSLNTIDDLTRYRASTVRPEEWVVLVIFEYFLDAFEHTAYIAKTMAQNIQNTAYKLCYGVYWIASHRNQSLKCLLLESGSTTF